MAMATNFVWRPTPAQRGLFEEWRGHALGLLVSFKDGIRVNRFGVELEYRVEETVPLEKMGFPAINHFLYEMGDAIEIRRWFNPDSLREELLVFIKESHVPQNMKHIRRMVNGQRKAKKPLRDKIGRIIKMTKTNSKPIELLELLKQAARCPPSRPLSASTTMANFVWRPTLAQRKLFQEWKNHALGLLVSSKDGIRVCRFEVELEERVEETVPLEKMGFPAINHFLYEISSSIEIRRWLNSDSLREELLVFVKESQVPQNMRHIRRMIKGQKNPKKPKKDKNGISIKMTKGNSALVQPCELLRQTPRGPQRPLLPLAKSIPEKGYRKRYAPSTSRATFTQTQTMAAHAQLNGNCSLSDFTRPETTTAPAYTFIGTAERNIPRHQQMQDTPTVSLFEPRAVEHILRDPRYEGFTGISVPKPCTSAQATHPQLKTMENVARNRDLFAAIPSTSRAMQGTVETVSMYPHPYEYNTNCGTSANEVVESIPSNSGFRTVVSAPDGSLKITVNWNKTDTPRITSVSATTAASAMAPPSTANFKKTSSTKPAKSYGIPQRDNTAAAVEAFTRSLRPAGQALPEEASIDSIQTQTQWVGTPPSLAQPPPLLKMLRLSEPGLLVQARVSLAQVPVFNPSLVGNVCPRHSVESIFSFDNNNPKAKFFKDLYNPAADCPLLPKVLPSKPAKITLSLNTFMDYYMGKNTSA